MHSIPVQPCLFEGGVAAIGGRLHRQPGGFVAQVGVALGSLDLLSACESVAGRWPSRTPPQGSPIHRKPYGNQCTFLSHFRLYGILRRSKRIPARNRTRTESLFLRGWPLICGFKRLESTVEIQQDRIPQVLQIALLRS